MTDDHLDAFPGLRRSLERMDSRVRELEGEHRVPVRELFPAGFMRRHTPFERFRDMLEAAEIDSESAEDLADDEAWDRFVAGHSTFGGWEAMVEAAGRAWVHRKLGFH